LVEGWFETYLLNVVSKGSVIVIDNASFHKKDTLFDVVEEADRTFLGKYEKSSPKLHQKL
jgi:hypothetical protein